MKQRHKKRKYSWLVFPNSENFKVKRFKHKRNVIKYLNSMGVDALNSVVKREVEGINYTHPSYKLFVWYNKYNCFALGYPFKLVLKQEWFRGRKYIFKETPISKETLRYSLKSDQIISLMCHIGNSENIDDSNLKNLLSLFKFRFGELPNNSNGYGENINTLKDCEWWYWSDRCGYERASTIVKCIRNERPYLLK